jgi:hypothetical protein
LRGAPTRFPRLRAKVRPGPQIVGQDPSSWLALGQELENVEFSFAEAREGRSRSTGYLGRDPVKHLVGDRAAKMAEDKRFELLRACTQHAFQVCGALFAMGRRCLRAAAALPRVTK